MSPPPSAAHMTPANVDLGVAIRLLRRARRLTIEDLAFAAKMHCSYVKFFFVGWPVGMARWAAGCPPAWTALRADHMPTGAMTSRSYRSSDHHVVLGRGWGRSGVVGGVCGIVARGGA